MMRAAFAYVAAAAARALEIWRLRGVEHELKSCRHHGDRVFTITCHRGCSSRVRIRFPPHRYDHHTGTWSRYEVLEGDCPWVLARDHGNDHDERLS